jgi:hypothetical protein
MSYLDAQMAIETALARMQVEKELMPSVASAQLDMALRALAPAVKRGEPTAIREWRNLIADKRKLHGIDARAEGENNAPVVISFSFESPSRVPVARVVGRSEAHDLRPAPDLLDRDRYEDRKDGSGSDLDLGGDSPR